MSGKKNPNRLVRGLVEALKEKCPSMFQKCPYSGHYELVNFALNKKAMSIYPAGIFRFDSIITDDVSKAFVSASLMIEIMN